MKNFVFMLPLLILGTFTINAMEQKKLNQNEYVNLDASQFELISYYTGNPDYLRFYKEYKAYKLPNKTISFPLHACDPLKLNTLGSIQYFFSSAITGNVPTPGTAVSIESPINSIIAIRGKNDLNGQRFEAYIGFDSKNMKCVGKKRIYNAQILAIQTKSTQHVDETLCHCFNQAKPVDTTQVGQEVGKQLKDLQDKDWKSPVFQKTLHELLGKEWTLKKSVYIYNHSSDIFTHDEAIVGNGIFFSNKVYWTEKENRLKGTTYKQH